jgi:hypothetical protein
MKNTYDPALRLSNVSTSVCEIGLIPGLVSYEPEPIHSAGGWGCRT